MKKLYTEGRILGLVLLALSIVILTGSNFFSNEFKYSKSLNNELSQISGNEKILVWVEFTDKGENDALLSSPHQVLTKESLQRRMKVRPADMLVDYSDLPLNEGYVSEVVGSGVELKQRSRWFNRISCYATEDQISSISDIECVKRLDIVRKFRMNYEYPERPENRTIVEEVATDNVTSLNYGSSLAQMQIINAVTTHDSGYFGQGVIIALLDAGVDNIQHPCFDSIRARGYRSYDFVNHDTIVADQTGQMGQGWHGTMTLSLVGGYRPGSLISPAFRAKYFLAKTENTDSETPLEEDNWIAGAEWADSLGADMITSSLGYIGMDPGSSRSYDWTWMNGDSCIITIGADLAVNKGMVVCNSAGNEGSNATHNTLGAPSDGDSVICVGSVTSTGTRSSFSSVGLTTDGRIKPDIMARGSGNYVAQTGAGSTGYTTGSGTSFSCPMTAGVVGQMLSANKTLTPIQVREILKQKASQYTSPDRFMGYGIINSWESVKLAKATVNPNVLNLKLFVEGLYNPGTSFMVSDTVRVFLRNAVSPFQKIDSAKGLLNSGGQGTFSFSRATGSSAYFIQVSHRSAIETWSKTTQTFFLNNLNYDFTTDSAKAYGNNMSKYGTKWVFYNGDADRNNVIDASDLSMMDNDAANYVSGYVSTDLDGNNFVDATDFAICANNAGEFVGTIRP
jgi:subtilisin family serine protease